MKQSKGMAGHQSHIMGKDEWLTPPWVLKKLPKFDLDPCALTLALLCGGFRLLMID